ncbi:metallophosphoesterase family protein [Polyangium aurulentum]|uniref:metallophosphoesterase family protein n=1 Tax=Polyangium aurulentum TaxID=2567896 RepID=UPI00146A0793|nr:metallophosphoesterase family protein [Polyangium aurulentum]UQA62697.1 metallophosphatase family protein [Polyangium aurulentum]
MKIRRLGFVGDVHAEDERLALALERLRGAGADLIACVGDIVDGPGDVDRCFELLDAPDVVSVRGNHERWFLGNDMRDLPGAHSKDQVSAETTRRIAALPATRSLDTTGGRLFLCHGLGADDMGAVEPWETEVDMMCNVALQRMLYNQHEQFFLNGHSHRRLVRRIEHRVLINAGTLFREHEPTFGLIDFDASRIRTWILAPDLRISEAVPAALPR